MKPTCVTFWNPRVKYSSLVGSGTSQSTRAHQARVPSWISKFKRAASASFQFIYPAWYPSLVGSGTLWSTRAHQARVLIWVFWKEADESALFSIFSFASPMAITLKKSLTLLSLVHILSLNSILASIFVIFYLYLTKFETTPRALKLSGIALSHL